MIKKELASPPAKLAQFNVKWRNPKGIFLSAKVYAHTAFEACMMTQRLHHKSFAEVQVSILDDQI